MPNQLPGDLHWLVEGLPTLLPTEPFLTQHQAVWDDFVEKARKPQLDKKQPVPPPLNICGSKSHTQLTIPVSYGMAQCLACNCTTQVDPIYTPGFTKKKRAVEVELESQPESEPPEFVDADEIPDDEEYEPEDEDE